MTRKGKGESYLGAESAVVVSRLEFPEVTGASGVSVGPEVAAVSVVAGISRVGGVSPYKKHRRAVSSAQREIL